MKGILRKVEVKEYKTREGKKFRKFEFTCDVIVDDKGTIKTRSGSYSEDFARKYFAYCGVQTKDLLGKEVGCVLAKRSYVNGNGEERIVEFIRFLNVLDKDGNSIVMPKEDGISIDF